MQFRREAIQASGKDKRAYKRHSYSAPILYEYHNTKNYFGAVMCNHSMGGMCFESEHALPTGVEIYIKMEHYAPDTNGPESRKGYRAEVRWCRKKNSSRPSCYEIGVNYFEPVLY